MKNIYKLIKLNRYIKSPRLRHLGVYLFHLFGKRYFGVFVDPVFACNLRCKMCYFSDDQIRKSKLTRALTEEEVEQIANAFFHRAMKVQIGCGAEPSLYKNNAHIISLAKQKGVPYVSMTTNANLYKEDDWKELLDAGLDEVTLSLHGVEKDTYEYFMTNANYEAFLDSLKSLTKLKKLYNLNVRVNYTVNKDNLRELARFFDVFNEYSIDYLQVRPIQQLGDTAYSDFSWNDIVEQYDSVIEKLRNEAKERGVTYIAPTKDDLTKEENESSSITESTYFYFNSRWHWKEDFDMEKDTYESYAKRTHLGRKLFRKIFLKEKNNLKNKKNLNYEIS